MIKKILFSVIVLSSAHTYSQLVTYDIPIGSTIGLEQTSGDICTAPFTVEEAKQMTIGNTWGCTWTSSNAATPSSIQIELMFTVGNGMSSHSTSLNGFVNNPVDPGGAVNCEQGTQLIWSIDPTNYNPMGVNTFLVDYSNSSIVNQLDNLPYAGDPYMRVSVLYSGTGLNELSGVPVELVKITDLMGRETEFRYNTPLIYLYSDGSSKRVYQVK